ncbi:MAG: hypothetical protein N4A40_09865 [Tissierellales bacterium]|jgi:hypothetical protein|nr:hypothetical protein [Tissierellales bacterium]
MDDQLKEFLSHSLDTSKRAKGKSDEGRIYISKKPEEGKKQPRAGYIRLPYDNINANSKCVSFILIKPTGKASNTVYLMMNCLDDPNKVMFKKDDKGVSNNLTGYKNAAGILEFLDIMSDESVSIAFTLEIDDKKTATYGYSTYRMVLKGEEK